ncbi:TetR family transcriptional regulator [Microbacterium immunditiarum]|uniref:AcrR family transcriptional regulator/catechol 2,3-dioxygenase-like lactoylglutathione lyase family enzyme n=1 Tax=Microbacterium immunditiarum TaxID=337480 RepID=A0A7Y9KI24_9MICO|nr:TetR family transcriptional regulator [Microbacterium immunditiarum]NYE20122.1 AcrR family transcriptional regulator/catechol 2,3-dioxygenase-like lactoylglutathione lyase family enzyme [Microbacterium immunditiarum]
MAPSDSASRTGRPRASSRETLAEAACELFLERGYAETSVSDITNRAGVSRSSFFNYFASKGDILWAAFDERIDAAASALTVGDEPVRAVIEAIAGGFAPDSLALAVANADAMGIADELVRERAIRQARLARAIAEWLTRSGADRLTAEVQAAALAGAVLAAVWEWADAGPGRTQLAAFLMQALNVASRGAPVASRGEVRQLRVVARAEDFEDALAFYRDVVGMPQAEAYEGEGGARVAILDAGRATLELSNPAQVELIDRVETDGRHSDRIRIALEVDDTAAVQERLADAGAEVEASARVTPWRSLNARVRGKAGLQLTLFQELGPEPQSGDEGSLA